MQGFSLDNHIVIIHVRPSGYCLIQLSPKTMPSLLRPAVWPHDGFVYKDLLYLWFCVRFFFSWNPSSFSWNPCFLPPWYLPILRVSLRPKASFSIIKSLFSARLLRYLQVFCFGVSLCSSRYAWTLCYGPVPYFAGDRSFLLSLMILVCCRPIVLLFYFVLLWYNS